MDIKDIIALASAGFTAQQIATMATPPVPAPVPTPVPAPVPAPVPVDPIMEQLKALTAAVQTNAIINSQLPITQPETPEDILASIINPPSIVNNK